MSANAHTPEPARLFVVVAHAGTSREEVRARLDGAGVPILESDEDTSGRPTFLVRAVLAFLGALRGPWDLLDGSTFQPIERATADALADPRAVPEPFPVGAREELDGFLLERWAKDGAVHVAEPCADPDASGLRTGGRRWTLESFPTVEEAREHVRALVRSTVEPSTPEEPDAQCSVCGARFWSADAPTALAVCAACVKGEPREEERATDSLLAVDLLLLPSDDTHAPEGLDEEERLRVYVERVELRSRGYTPRTGERGRYTYGADGADVSHAEACERERLRVELEPLDPYTYGADVPVARTFAALADRYAALLDASDREDLQSIREEAQEELLARVEGEGRSHGTVRTVRTSNGRSFLAVDTYTPKPTDAQRAADRAERCGLDAGEVLDGFTRCAWADAWASAIERAAETYADEGEESPAERAERAQWERPNLSGVELTEAAPRRIRGDFRAWARPIVRSVLLAVPESTLRAWAEYGDAERVGSSLYLDAVGHGAGLADLDLPRASTDEGEDGRGESRVQVHGLPYSGGLPRGFGYLEVPLLDWTDLQDRDGEHALPLAEDMLAADVCSTPADNWTPEGAAEAISGALRAWRAGNVDAEGVLALADSVLGGFGLEEVQLPAPEEGESGGTFRYVNRGDTYTGTLGLLEDADGERFLASDWGGVLERAEAERTECTGETRCGYCGAWGLGGLDAAELDYRDARDTGEECAECGHGAE